MNKLIKKLNKMEEKIEDTIFDMNLQPSHEGWAVCWEEAEEEITSLFIWKDLTTVLGSDRAIIVNVTMLSGKTKTKIVSFSRTLKAIQI